MVRVQILQQDGVDVSGEISGRFGNLVVEKSTAPHDEESYMTFRQVSLYKAGSLVLFRDEVKALRGLLTRLLEDMG